MNQEDLDYSNAIKTMSKLLFFKKLRTYNINLDELMLYVSNNKNISVINAKSQIYDKAYEYHKEEINNSKELYNYILST